MSSDIFQCVGITVKGRRCRRCAVRALKSAPYVCPTHIGKPLIKEWRKLVEAAAVPRQGFDGRGDLT